MTRRYVVERTDRTGHWVPVGAYTQRREALRFARSLRFTQKRVTVRVRAPHEPLPIIACWVNGYAASGEAFLCR